MAQTHANSARVPAAHATKPAEKSATAEQNRTVDRTAELSEEVLKSVEAGQRAAIEAVRRFVDTVDEVVPAMGDRPSAARRSSTAP